MLPTVTFRSQQTETEKWQIRKRDFNAHRLLRAIDNNTLLSKLPKQEEGNPDDFLRPVDELKRIYAAYPYMIENTQKRYSINAPSISILKARISIRTLKLIRVAILEITPCWNSFCEKGLLYRYKNPNERILKRIQTELEVIKQQGFMSYFLINWDICKYARSKGYFYVGRGSKYNSVVAYLLRITDADPRVGSIF